MVRIILSIKKPIFIEWILWCLISCSERLNDKPIYMCETLELFEIPIFLEMDNANPFDPSEIEVWVNVIMPDKRTVRVDAFWYQDFIQEARNGREILIPNGAAHFLWRFRPQMAGKHHLECYVQRKGSLEKHFEAILDVRHGKQKRKGFIRRDTNRGFIYDNGETYLPVGINVDWTKSIQEFEYYYYEMNKAGLNWSRLWMTHFNGTALEWKEGEDEGGYCGLGCYNLKAGWRLDKIIELAEKYGVAIQLVLAQHSQFEVSMWSSWDRNPYNIKNGGILSESAKFFTDERAIALFDKKIKYVVARWAHSPAILAFELMNEIDLIKGYEPEKASQWMRGRASFIRELDPYHHLVTTSYAIPGHKDADQDWGYDGFDIIQLHSYIPMYWETLEFSIPYLIGFGKPVIIGEFGIDFLGQEMLKDKKGVHLLNATILSLLLGSTSGVMSWWWDSYIAKYDLFSVIATPVKTLSACGIKGWEGNIEVELINGDQNIVHVSAKTKDGVIVWLHDRLSEWDNPEYQGKVFNQTKVKTNICNDVIVDYYDPWLGAKIQTLSGDNLILVPEFSKDIILCIRCLSGAVP